MKNKLPLRWTLMSNYGGSSEGHDGACRAMNRACQDTDIELSNVRVQRATL